jgi:hypothetical protein
MKSHFILLRSFSVLMFSYLTSHLKKASMQLLLLLYRLQNSNTNYVLLSFFLSLMYVSSQFELRKYLKSDQFFVLYTNLLRQKG